MSKDKTETRKPYANCGASYHEHESIDWSKPNEETGYYSKGRRGSA
jgi:hypothetical protein